MGTTVGGLRLLREELEAENSGVSIPAEIRWLSRAKAQARFQEIKGGASSVVAAVLGDVTFSHVCKSGIRLFGRRYEVEAFEEARQTPSATGAVVGATSPLTAQQTPGAPSVQRTTPRKCTGAPSRDAGWDEAAGVHMRLPSVPTARAPMHSRDHILDSIIRI